MAVTALSTKPSTPNRIRPPLIPSEKQNDALKEKLRTPSPMPSSSTTTRSLSVSFQGQAFSFQVSKSNRKPKPPVKPTEKTRMPNPLTRSLDCSGDRKDSTLVAVRLLRHSMVLDDDKKKVKRASFDTEDLCLSSDSDSLSSEEIKGRPTPRGIVVPARFLRQKKSGPSRIVVPSVKRKESPRNGGGKPGNAPSMVNFAAEARRGRKGERLIEEAHMMRMLHNRYLQWRCVNAQADAALSSQRRNVKENLYNASITLSKMRDFVTLKRLELQLLTQDIKLISILKDEMIYLEDWSLMDREHCNSLSGIIGALKASTLRLPIVGGARANIQELQSSIGSAIDVMQAMGTSICSLLPKVEGATALLSEVVKTVALELSLLDQSKDLLSIVADMHMKQCSLQGHILQINRETNPMQL